MTSYTPVTQTHPTLTHPCRAAALRGEDRSHANLLGTRHRWQGTERQDLCSGWPFHRHLFPQLRCPHRTYHRPAQMPPGPGSS